MIHTNGNLMPLTLNRAKPIQAFSARGLVLSTRVDRIPGMYSTQSHVNGVHVGMLTC